MVCPKSVISGESLALVQEYLAWKLLGVSPGSLRELPGKTVDAWMVLEVELRKEAEDSGREVE